MMENDIHADSADESDDESDEYDVEEMNLHEIAHTDTPNKVKLEYILDEIQEDDDEDDEDEDEDEDEETDHWGQSVEQYDDRQMGAGEKCQCQRCASRHIALVAATEDTSATNWEEFYQCDCGAEGSLRVEGTDRIWTGAIDYPEVRR